MSGETDLDALFAGLTPKLDPDLHVFVTLNGPCPDGVTPRMVFEEAEGTTLILRHAEAEAHGFAFEFPCRMITLEIHSSLEAVGFIARITTELARNGMGVNPVSGFYHDHLFVPDGREDEAMEILAGMAG